jgi:hypothetical protein
LGIAKVYVRCVPPTSIMFVPLGGNVLAPHPELPAGGMLLLGADASAVGVPGAGAEPRGAPAGAASAPGFAVPPSPA